MPARKRGRTAASGAGGLVRGCISGGTALRWAAVLAAGGGRCARDPAAGARDRPDRVSTQFSRADDQRRCRLPTGARVRRHGAVRVLAGRIADGDSATGDAVSGARRSSCWPSSAVRRASRTSGTREGDTAIADDWWARVIGAPWSAEPGLRHFRASLWQLFRGPTTAKEPPPAELSRRYTELLFENLGQPGFRELIVATLDLETRGDLVFAAIGEARRQAFFQRGPRRSDRSERRRAQPGTRRARGGACACRC